jgi:hypothetical protein
MIFQADSALLARVRRCARDRGISTLQVIRAALERELAEGPRPPLRSIGVVEGPGNLAGSLGEIYQPDPFRS